MLSNTSTIKSAYAFAPDHQNLKSKRIISKHPTATPNINYTMLKNIDITIIENEIKTLIYYMSKFFIIFSSKSLC